MNTASRGSLISWLLWSLFLLYSYHSHQCHAVPSLDGRYSFSLTTFDPSGKLGQVERAATAASLGTPVVAVIQGQDVLLASPQILPSPFFEDDGTSRFAVVAPHIAIAHSGIGADGRILVAAAQRLAVEHSYTFDEAIPVDLFLEELSLLFQEYTMKPAARPFGVTLLVAYLPPTGVAPRLFRIDPSGAVLAVEEKYAIVNGKFSAEQLDKLKGLSDIEAKPSLLSAQTILADVLEDAVMNNQLPKESGTSETIPLPTSIICASFTKEDGLQVMRRTSTKTS